MHPGQQGARTSLIIDKDQFSAQNLAFYLLHLAALAAGDVFHAPHMLQG